MSAINLPTNFISCFMILVFSVIFYNLWIIKDDFQYYTSKYKLQTCLQEKIEASKQNLELAQECHHSEQKYIALLFKIQELHETVKQKSLNIKSLTEENQDLKEEVALLKRLFING